MFHQSSGTKAGDFVSPVGSTVPKPLPAARPKAKVQISGFGAFFQETKVLKDGGVLWETIPQGIYPLVNIQKAIENDHRNSGFSH